MSFIKFGMLACSLFAFTAVALAAEPDELRERARAMQREAAELTERGHEAEAEKLQRQSRLLFEEAERRMHVQEEQRHTEMRDRQERLERLRLEAGDLARANGNKERLTEVRHEAERIERELHDLSEGGHRDEVDPRQEMARRLEHMRAAIEHLDQAGLHDIAEHVTERAEATEREMHEHERHHGGDPIQEIMKQLDEMRHEFGRLRDEVNELRRRGE